MSVAGSSIRAGRAFVELSADNSKLIRGLRAAEKRVSQYGKNIQHIGSQMVFSGIASAAPFVASVKKFADFDDQMRIVKAVTQSTGKSFDQLTEKAKTLGRTTSFGANEVAAAMAELGRMGFSGYEIENSIAGILDLSRATATDLSMSALYAAGTLRSFSMDASRMTEVVDILTVTANSSAQTLTDLGEAMKYAGPVAAEFGLTLKETAKALATMAQFNIKGAMGGTSLRNIMLRMARSPIRKILKEIGISTSDAKGRLRPLADTLSDIGVALSKMTPVRRIELLDQIFGMRAITGGSKLTKESFEDINTAIDNFKGTANRTAREMDAGIGGSLRRLHHAAIDVALAIGKSLDKAVTVAAAVMKDAAKWTSKFVEQHNLLAPAIAASSVAVIGLGFGLIATGIALRLAGVGLKAFLVPLKMIPVALGMILSPIGLCTAAVVSLGVLWQKQSGVISVALSRIKNHYRDIASLAKPVYDALSKSISQGNLSKAFDVAVASIDVVWAKLCLDMETTWIAATSKLLAIYSGFCAGVVSLNSDMWYMLEKMAFDTGPAFKSAMAVIESDIAKMVNRIRVTYKKLFNTKKEEKRDQITSDYSTLYRRKVNTWNDIKKNRKFGSQQEYTDAENEHLKDLAALKKAKNDAIEAMEKAEDDRLDTLLEGMNREADIASEKTITDLMEGSENRVKQNKAVFAEMIRGIGQQIAEAIKNAKVELSDADKSKLQEAIDKLEAAKQALAGAITVASESEEAMSAKERFQKAQEDYQKARTELSKEYDPLTRKNDEESLSGVSGKEARRRKEMILERRERAKEAVRQAQQELFEANKAYRTERMSEAGRGVKKSTEKASSKANGMNSWANVMERLSGMGNRLKYDYSNVTAEGSFSGFARMGIQGESDKEKMADSLDRIAANTDQLVTQGMDASEGGV